MSIVSFENFEYTLLDDDGIETVVSKEDFIKAGAEKAMSSELITIDSENRKIIAKFEDFKF